MKIFLLAVTFLLLIGRIEYTPFMLSKNIYYKNMRKEVDKRKVLLKGQSEDSVNILESISAFFILLLWLLEIIYYILIGSRFPTNVIILLLSAVQIVTVIISAKKDFNIKPLSRDIEDYKFCRWYFLFNVILDYIYYPLTIYMLLK